VKKYESGFVRLGATDAAANASEWRAIAAAVYAASQCARDVADRTGDANAKFAADSLQRMAFAVRAPLDPTVRAMSLSTGWPLGGALGPLAGPSRQCGPGMVKDDHPKEGRPLE